MSKTKAVILLEEFEKASPEVQEACLKLIRAVPKTKKIEVCKNPKECSVSTDISGFLSFGYGELNDMGYWEHNCDACEKKYLAEEKAAVKAFKNMLEDW